MSGEDRVDKGKLEIHGQVKLEEVGGAISRRKLLASLGVAGAAVIAGSLFPTGAFAAEEKGKSKSNGKKACDPDELCGRVTAIETDLGEQVQLVDFGADGSMSADTAALAALAAYVNAFPNGTQPVGIVDGIPVRVEIKSRIRTVEVHL